MTRLLLLAAAVIAAAMLLPFLPLLAPQEPIRTAPVVAIPSPLARPEGPKDSAAVRLFSSQTVASLRAVARRRGIRSVAGVPVAQCRKAALLAALA